MGKAVGTWLKGLLVAAMACGAAGTAMAADGGWTKPTPEELSMTSVPGYPGVPAVILNREEVTKDDLHVKQRYMRIKVLSEKGKEYANVELPFISIRDNGDWNGDEKNITDIQGRTIHPDGTVIPFTGKPYLKKYEKNALYVRQARVFTLPDVEVGSIIEYRYSTRIADNLFEAPYWTVQDELFTKKVHFLWYPTMHELSSERGTVQSIAWFPILPEGSKLERHEVPATTPGGGRQAIFELTAGDIAPKPADDHMPPMASFTYRVAFYYTAFRNGPEFWKDEGKDWSKHADSFAGPDGGLRDATKEVIAGATTEEEKLRKIYAAVMAMENTDYTREHGANENKAEGLGKVSNAFDVYKHKRGSSEQLTKLFVGMARAADMKAYMMLVPDRSERLFTPAWLTLGQFDNVIAIVNVNGKEQFFDPGSRYCPYGSLAWQSTFVQGLRQSEKGTEFATTPGETYKAVRTQRVGDLTVDEHGNITGTLTVTYTGQPALAWRHRGLKGDEESLKQGLKSDVADLLPKTLGVKVTQVENLQEYEKPLVAHFEVTGSMGTVTSKRMILPMDVFVAEEPGTFPHEKRDLPVYFHYAEIVQDAVRLKFPVSMMLEAAPTDTKLNFEDVGQYTVSSMKVANSVTVRRNLIFNGVIIPLKDFGTLRTFYSQFESKDKDSIVLKAGGAPATAGN